MSRAPNWPAPNRADLWASHDYQDSLYPTGQPASTCEEALNTLSGLYLGDPTGLDLTPTNL